jgi:hypothetical protein
VAIWERAIQERIIESFRSDGELAAVYYEYLYRMRQGRFDDGLVQAIGQRRDGDITIEDAYCFAQLHVDIAFGRVLIGRFNVQAAPRGDRDRGFNQRCLDSLNDFVDGYSGERLAFEVDFLGGPGDQDGFITSRREMIFSVNRCTAGCCPRTSAIVPSGTRFPLEVGTTTAARSLAHLHQERALARWPYGSHFVTFFFVPDVYDVVTQKHLFDV